MHFGSVLPQSAEESTILDQWLDLKHWITAQVASKPQDMYSSLLESKPENLPHILLLVKITMVLSASTAA